MNELERLEAMLRAQQASLSIEQRRAASDALGDLFPLAADVRVHPGTLAQVAGSLRSIGLDVGSDQRQVHQVALRAAAADANGLRQRTFEALDRFVPTTRRVRRKAVGNPDHHLAPRISTIGDALPDLTRSPPERL